MGIRISFDSREVRDLFFRKCLESLNFETWNQMANFLETRRSVLSRYRDGKLTLSENFYMKLSAKIDKNDKELLSRNITILKDNWGRIKAGKITYHKYKRIFDEGRKKAINAVRNRAHKFNTDIPLGKELAYFIGLFIGDGFTNKYGRYYLTQFTGDKRFEKEFYSNLVANYSKNLFNLNPIIYEDKNTNALRFSLYSKDLFNLITKRFQISAGRKSKNVLIPNEILDSKPVIIKSFIRGLYDAEGCVFFDKRESYTAPYPRIDLHMNNLELLKQIYSLLNRFEIKCTLVTIKDNLRVIIYGEDKVRKFIKEIGFSNPKHLKKLEVLK